MELARSFIVEGHRCEPFDEGARGLIHVTGFVAGVNQSFLGHAALDVITIVHFKLVA